MALIEPPLDMKEVEESLPMEYRRALSGSAVHTVIRSLLQDSL